jgi:catechol 2,3-dioxygenase-like lactoylglutathione lyase family enzyme
MGVKLTKDSIDLGIVVSDPERSLAFYRDTLGFKDEGTMPLGGGATMYRLLCGTSLIKLVHHPKELPAAAPWGRQPRSATATGRSASTTSKRSSTRATLPGSRSRCPSPSSAPVSPSR